MKLQKVAGNYLLPYTIRAAWTTYFITIILCIYMLIFLIFITFHLKPPTNWEFFWGGFTVLFIIIGGGCFIFKFYKILLQEDKIIYRSLFSKVKEIPFSDIGIIKVDCCISFSWAKPPVGIFTYSSSLLKSFIYSPYDPFSPGYCLNIYGKKFLSIPVEPLKLVSIPVEPLKLLSIPLKPFHRKDLAIIVDTITTKVPSVEIDENVRILKESYFASNLLEGIKDIFPFLIYLLIMLVIPIFIAFVLIRTFAPLMD